MQYLVLLLQWLINEIALLQSEYGLTEEQVSGKLKAWYSMPCMHNKFVNIWL